MCALGVRRLGGQLHSRGSTGEPRFIGCFGSLKQQGGRAGSFGSLISYYRLTLGGRVFDLTLSASKIGLGLNGSSTRHPAIEKEELHGRSWMCGTPGRLRMEGSGGSGRGVARGV